jgi:hypothetical protein
VRLGHLAIVVLLTALVLLAVPRLWRLGAAMFMLALVLATVSIAADRP